MTTVNKISTLVEQQFPEFIRTDGPMFVAFMEAYYEWMEQTGNAIDANQNLLSYHDVDNTLDAYLEYFEADFLPNIPRSHLANTPNLLKNVSSFYRARGSEKSFELMFRILYDDSVEFYYPGTDILRASDGKWTIKTTLTALGYNGSDELFAAEGFQITGGSSGASGVVEQVLKTYSAGAPTYTFYVSPKLGTFVAEEVVTSTSGLTFVVDVVSSSDGLFVGTDGFLSSNKYLQDNYYYQEYSYVLKTTQYVERYRDILQRIVHPSGTAMFGQIAFIDDLDLSSTTTLELTNNLEPEMVAISDLIANNLFANSEITITVEADTWSTPYDVPQYGVTETTSSSTLTGTVTPSGNSTIEFYESDLISLYASIPISEIGNGSSFIGTGTLFTTELEIGDFIIVVDPTETNPDQGFLVDAIGGDTFIDVNNVYSGILAAGTVHKRSAILTNESALDWGSVAVVSTLSLDWGSLTQAPMVYNDYRDLS